MAETPIEYVAPDIPYTYNIQYSGNTGESVSTISESQALNFLNASIFNTKLVSSGNIDKGTVPTIFSRNSISTTKNDQDNLIYISSNEVRCNGARRTNNLWPGSTIVFSSSAATTNSGGTEVLPNTGVAPDGTSSAYTIRNNAGSGNSDWWLLDVTSKTSAGGTYSFSIYLQTVSGSSETITLTLWDNISAWIPTAVLVTGDRSRFTITGTFSSTSTDRRVGFQTFGASVQGCYCSHPQLLDIGDQRDTTVESDYVAVGALIKDVLDPNFLRLPGTSAHYASTTDSVNNSFLNSIDIRIKCSPNMWDPASVYMLLAKGSSSGNYSFTWYMYLGALYWQGSSDGVNFDRGNTFSTASISLINGTIGWLRVTRSDVTGNIYFYESTDGATWTPIGAVRTSTSGGLFNSSHDLTISNVANPFNGDIYEAQIYDEVGGTDPLIDFNPDRDALYSTGSFVSSTTDETWNINGASSIIRNKLYRGTNVDAIDLYNIDRDGTERPTDIDTPTYSYIEFIGGTTSRISSPSSLANSNFEDIDIIAQISVVDTTPAVPYTIVSKWDDITRRSFAFLLDTTGKLNLLISEDGSIITNNILSSVAISTAGIVAFSPYFVRVTFVGSTGIVNFYTSDTGEYWDQLGTPDIAGTISGIASTASVLEIGASLGNGTWPFIGRIHLVQIYNGIDGALETELNPADYVTGGSITSSATDEVYTLFPNVYIPPTNYPVLGAEIEETSQNLLPESNNFSLWSTAGGTPTLTKDTIGPDGKVSAWTVVDNDGSQNEAISSPSLTLTNVPYTFSIFIKKTNIAPTYYPVIWIIDTGYGSVGLATIDPVNGVITPWTSYTGIASMAGVTARISSYKRDYWRAELTATATATTYYARFGSGLATSSTQAAGLLATAGTGTQVFFGAQVEPKSKASTYIPTEGTPITRSADIYTYSTTNLVLATQGTILLSYTPNYNSGDTVFLWGTYVDSNNYTGILHDGTYLIFRKRISSVNYDASILMPYTAETVYNIIATWDSERGSTICLNGSMGTSSSNTTDAQIASTMQIGSNGNSLQQCNGKIRNVRIWQYANTSPDMLSYVTTVTNDPTIVTSPIDSTVIIEAGYPAVSTENIVIDSVAPGTGIVKIVSQWSLI